MADETPSTSAARRLSKAFAVLLLLAVGLMVLGALVRAHEAGLACPDWPLCFGEFVPQMDLQVAFEYSHRVAAGAISLIFVALAVLTLRQPSLARPMRGWLAATAIILVIQILLGALTVWQLLAAWTVTAHLLTGNAFAISLMFCEARLYELANPQLVPVKVSARTRAWLSVAALLLVAQITLGGLVSSTFAGMACPEWPACNGGTWFPSWRGSVGLHLLHRWNAILLLGALAGSAWSAWNTPGMRGVTLAALLLALLQVVVGIANVLLALPVEVTGSHSGLAAALVLVMAFAVRRAFLEPRFHSN